MKVFLFLLILVFLHRRSWRSPRYAFRIFYKKVMEDLERSDQEVLDKEKVIITIVYFT